MKALFTALLITLASSVFAQEEHLNEMDIILGEWTAINQTIRRDGSGLYDLDSALYFKVHKTLGGHGHQVDWFSTDGTYGGSTLRVFSSTENAWLSKWFDPEKGQWMDEVRFQFNDGGLRLLDKMKDETGEYEVKREHRFSADGQTYEYHHYRKYAGMGQWLLIDKFEAKRVR